MTVGTPASLAAKQVTETVPIVMIAVGDPVGTGLAKSLARPGGNSTGISNLAADLTPKLLDLMRAAVPALSHAAVLLNPANPVHTVYRRETETAAGRMGVKLEAVEVRQPEEFEEAVAAMARRRSGRLHRRP